MMYCQDHSFLVELESITYTKNNVENFLHIVA
jgi:hypothetical protein